MKAPLIFCFFSLFILSISCKKENSHPLSGKIYIPVSILSENCDDPNDNVQYSFDEEGCYPPVCYTYNFETDTSGFFSVVGPFPEVRNFNYNLSGDELEICFSDQDMECYNGHLSGDRIVSTGVDPDGCENEIVLKRK